MSTFPMSCLYFWGRKDGYFWNWLRRLNHIIFSKLHNFKGIISVLYYRYGPCHILTFVYQIRSKFVVIKITFDWKSFYFESQLSTLNPQILWDNRNVTFMFRAITHSLVREIKHYPIAFFPFKDISKSFLFH